MSALDLYLTTTVSHDALIHGIHAPFSWRWKMSDRVLRQNAGAAESILAWIEQLRSAGRR